MPPGRKTQLGSMTSLPVVIEDAADTDLSDGEESSTDYCQEALQHTLDLCLENLDKLQLSPDTNCSTSSPAVVNGCVSVIPASTANSSEDGKSDSGFWSQSFDSYRCSMAALEDSVDLDAILGELCALEDVLENETRAISVANTSLQQNGLARYPNPNPPVTKFGPSVKPMLPQKPDFATANMPPGTNAKSVSPVAVEFDLVDHYYKQGATAESPDNDSAFSDNVSCISSESGASRTDASCLSSGSSSKSSNGSLNAPSPTQTTTASSSSDAATINKTEKIKIALEKINEGDTKKFEAAEARIQELTTNRLLVPKVLFITVHFNDEIRKSLLIDERMDCLDVCQSLAEKSETKLSPDCTIVEYLPELNIERFFEDHENLVENLLMWDRDGNGKNKLLYVERRDKYNFISRPEIYLTGFACKDTDYDELSRRALLKDYFSSHAISPPELEGYLHLKTEAKKGWKKYWFVLRSSGLYYTTKPKVKQPTSADLICLTPFDSVNLYRGVSWKKKLKAPTDFGFALKHPQIQSAKALKNIRLVCTDDQPTLDLWMTGIRIAKYGRHLIDNFNKALERAANMEAAREEQSNSASSSAQQTPVLNRRLSSGDTAFDDDLTTGTIKRKPNPASGTPKLPFTPKTSHILMRSADERRSFNSRSSSHSSEPTENEVLPPPPPELLSPTIETILPLSPSLLRSPPPTPPKPPALQRKPSLGESRKLPESRHSIGPTPSSPAHSAPAQVSPLPFFHELKTKSHSPLVTKKVLQSVPETHDILSQPSSPATVPTPASPARVLNGHARPQSMSPIPVSPSHKPKLPPPPPRRSDMTKLESNYERSVSLGGDRFSTANPDFMADLTRVLAQKKRHSALLHEVPFAVDEMDYLPPPPPELLKGLSPLPYSEDVNLRKKPPPPPKRSDGTYLTRGK